MNPTTRSTPTTTTALLTDHYELTMLEAARTSGVADRRATFELFTRRLPQGRRYGVVGGIGRAIDAIEAFRFEASELAWLRQQGFLHADTIDWLAAYRFGGNLLAYAEGDLHFPHSPVLRVEATFGEAVILETLLLSILNHDSAIAAAAARMVEAAQGHPLIEMGGRRTHEEAAVAAARTAYLCGFASSSNLEAGRRHGVPTRGTAAHAFTLAHDDEREAFRAQVAAAGPDTTLLVDTFDTPQGIRNAVEAAGPQLGAIRIDSGDPADEARKARRLLDELGATNTRIVVTGDMDEYTIEDLVADGAPIDGYGVGTRLVTGSGHPTAGFVYKLVAIEQADGTTRDVAKTSIGKANAGGVKDAYRSFDPATGFVAGEHLVRAGAIPSFDGGRTHRSLQQPYLVDGAVVRRPTNDEIRATHRSAMGELRSLDRSTTAGPPLLIATLQED